MLYFIQNIREDDVRKQLVEYVKTTSAIYDEKHIFNLVDNLLKTGFLEDFRSDKEKEKNELVLNKLKVTNKGKVREKQYSKEELDKEQELLKTRSQELEELLNCK